MVEFERPIDKRIYEIESIKERARINVREEIESIEKEKKRKAKFKIDLIINSFIVLCVVVCFMILKDYII